MKRLSAFILVLVLCFTIISPAALADSGFRDTRVEAQLAANLKCLGLFKGVSDTDFALDRAPTRIEAIVMLVRSLGKESDALRYGLTSPFTDVPDWASMYVGYAYQSHLTNGISATEFGTGEATASMYVTFALRSLDYSDQNGDFSWDQPFSLAKSIGLLPDRVQLKNFLRADAVTVTYSSLPVKMKSSSSTTLADKLIADGVFTGEEYETYYDANAISKAESASVLSPVEIYAKCSPAVFYLELYNSKGAVSATASGFFIDSNGTAVTNYHAIKNAYSAKITTSDTNTVYDVEGVYSYSAAQDWAIIKVKGSNFSHLDLGNSSAILGGEAVYAIGNPLALKNSISDGIVSNTARQIDKAGPTYIQITAPISQGSSGGALINEYGKVIGITTATSTAGQNINLAVPINDIIGYTTQSCQSLIAVNINSRSSVSAYSSFTDVPDCGALCGVDAYRSYVTSVSATYYYAMDAINGANAWTAKDNYTYPKYLDELTDWGFKYQTEFQTGTSKYWEFNYTSNTASYIVLVGTTKLNGIDCLSVQITTA